MGSMQHLIRVNQRFPVDRAVHRHLAVLGCRLVPPVQVVLVLLAGLGLRLVLGVRLGLVLHWVLLVLGKRLSEFHLDRVLLAGRASLAVLGSQHLLRVQLVRVGLGLLQHRGLLAVHQVRVVRLVHRFRVVLVVQRGTIGKRYLVVGKELPIHRVVHRLLVVLGHLAVQAVLRVLVVLVGLVDSSERMGCIDNVLATRLLPDASDGRCC